MIRASRTAALIGVVTAAALASATTSVAAASTVTLGGFGLGAVASGASLVYYEPQAPVPVKPTVEDDVAYSTAALQTGSVGRALSSAAWPGDFVAGAGPALGLILPVNPGLGAYPVRAQASYPQGASQQDNTSIPGTAMSARARRGTVAASVSDGTVSAAVIVNGAFSSRVSAAATTSTVTTIGHAGATDVDVLGGLVHVGSVTSDVRVSTDGVRHQSSGAASVSGITIAGVPITVDDRGAHIDNQGTNLAPAALFAEGLLRSGGLTVVLAQPVDTVRPSYVERDAGGLIIAVDASTLKAFVASLPGGVGQQIVTVLNPQETLVVSLGTVDVVAATVTGGEPASSISLPPVSSFGVPALALTAPVLASANRVLGFMTRTDVPVGAPAGGSTGPGATLPFVTAASRVRPFRGPSAKGIFLASILMILAASLLWRLAKYFGGAGGGGCALEQGGASRGNG